MGLLDALRGERKTLVKMSVSAGEYVAGKQYKLPVDLADQFLAKGYASGGMSREFSEDELKALRGNAQVVQVGA